ncbi:MAG: chromate transporter [Clostridia bacterium]|nr:chromate transporter [Clostridia bacterium]
MIYLQLLWSFFKVGFFSFGGGYAAVPLIQNEVVNLHGWLSLTEFTDLITISQMTPGPIAINSATFVGIKIAGFGGALVSTLGNILPSTILVSLLAWLYGKYQNLFVIKGILAGLRPTVVALILSAGLSILILSFWGVAGVNWNLESIDLIAVALFIAGLLILRKFKPNPIMVMLGSGVIGGICYLLF